MNILLNFCLTLLSAVYPLIYLWDKQHFLLAYIPVGLIIFWLIKCFIQKEQKQRYFAIAMSLFFIIIAISRNQNGMYWYPVIINSLMLALFGGSLFSRQSFIERLARLTDPNLPPKAVRYTRNVTKIWCAVFSLNIIICVWLIFTQQYDYWAIFTGIISYLIFAVVMITEWLIRQLIIKKEQNKK